MTATNGAANLIRMAMNLLPVLRLLLPKPAAVARRGGSRRRHARAVVILGLGLVLAALLGMATAVETVKPEWRDPEYGHRLRQLQHLRAAHPGRPLVVAIGSSRTQMGVSPAAMGFADEPGSPLVYNFGQSGAGPLRLLLTLLRLLDDGVKPDFLLVELFPAALVADGPADGSLAKIGPRLSARDLRHLESYCADPAGLRRQWAADRLASWHSLRLTLLSHWQPHWLPWQHRLAFQWDMMDGFGFTPHPYQVMPPGEREKGIERVRKDYHAALASFRVGTTSDRALRELVGRCRTEGIPVAFYLMPEGPAFRSWYAWETRTAIATYLETLSRETGVPVFDAAAGFAEGEFADGHHLLRHGATRFSRKLADECIRPWVRDR